MDSTTSAHNRGADEKACHAECHIGACGPPMDMKVLRACHSDPAAAGEESASYLLLAKANSSSLRPAPAGAGLRSSECRSGWMTFAGAKRSLPGRCVIVGITKRGCFAALISDSTRKSCRASSTPPFEGL